MTQYKESSIESPVLWFENFLYHEGIDLELIHFIDNADIFNAHFNAKENSYTYNEQDNNGQWEKIVIRFSDHLSQLLATQRKRSKILVDDFIEQTSDELIQKKYLLKTLDKLQALIKIVSKLNYKHIIQPKLISIVEHIKIKYYAHKLGHPVYSSLGNSSFIEYRESFFGSDRSGLTLLKGIYSLFYNQDIIDEDLSENEFIEVFMSETPNQTGVRIRFMNKNTEIAYILREIEPMFTNLSFRTIEESNCFYNKQGKLLNRTDLDTALNRLRQKKSFNDLYLVSHNVRLVILGVRDFITKLNLLNSTS